MSTNAAPASSAIARAALRVRSNGAMGLQRVKALVEIFGRETPVELSFTQIQKV